MMKSTVLISICVLVFSLIAACTPPTAVSTAGSDTAQLRIENVGDHDIFDLVVLFPGSSDVEAGRVEFGDIFAGFSTVYRDVPGGVYRYAAYEYLLDGQVKLQPVIDWVGEVPMNGEKFVYQIEFDPQGSFGNQVRLVGCAVEAPVQKDGGCLLTVGLIQ